jgi:chemotaxis family two-component system sensor kinase Cph1
MVTQVLMALQSQIVAQGVVMTRDPLPTVWANATQLRQVWQHLLSNALKFHGEQPCHIHVTAQRKATAWMFAVRDNGIGLASAEARRIFAPFHRLHPQEVSAGTGLGLAICQRIVEAHGGHIWVVSAPGQGATFFFTIPDGA